VRLQDVTSMGSLPRRLRSVRLTASATAAAAAAAAAVVVYCDECSSRPHLLSPALAS